MSLIQILLYPIAIIWSLVLSLRNYFYNLGIIPSYTSKFPIICVGNIVLGGSGKSPTVMLIVQELLNRGYTPILLTRGYGGKISSFHQVTEQDTSILIGDEALMMYHKFPTTPFFIAPKRVFAVRKIEQLYANEINPIIVLDDGYQHRALNRDCNLLLVDVCTHGVEGGLIDSQIFPSGTLRESFQSGIDRASAIILISREAFNDQVLLSIKNQWKKYSKPVFILSLESGNFVDIVLGREVSASHFENKKVFIFSSIAKPDQFLLMLKKKINNIVGYKYYRDHFSYDQKDIEFLISQDSDYLITTEKDAAKIKELTNIKNKFYALRLQPRVVGDTLDNMIVEIENFLK